MSGYRWTPLGVWMLIGLAVFLVVWAIWARRAVDRQFRRDNPRYIGRPSRRRTEPTRSTR